MFTEIKKLRTFVAVAEEASLTKAAARLRAAQPWVSDQIKDLETMLGVQLIERSRGRPTNLTSAGKEILAIARRLLRSCIDADEEMRACRERNMPRLVLGVETPTLFIPERNALLDEFRERARDTRLEILSCATTRLVEGLANGQFDLILTSATPSGEDVEAMPFYDCVMRLAVPKGSEHRYAEARSGRLRRVQLLVMRESYHPKLATWKALFIDDEIEWVECPEDSFAALMLYSSQTGIATLTPDLPQVAEFRHNFEFWSIQGRSLAFRYSLMRRRGYQNSSRDMLWRLAQSHVRRAD